MAILLFDHGAFRVEAKYVQRKKNTYYFRRRVPQDVQHKYPTKKSVDFVSLGTSDPHIAAKKAHLRAAEQDALWEAWRNGQNHTSRETRKAAYSMLESYELKPNQYKTYSKYAIEPDQFLDELRHLSQSGTGEITRDELPEYAQLAEGIFHGEMPKPLMSDAVELYENLKGEKNSQKSKANRAKVLEELYALAGDIPVESYTRNQANMLVERLRSKENKTTTIKRKINYISPVVATALREYEIDKQNVFHKLDIPDFGDDETARDPYTDADLYKLKEFYLEKDDDIRWIAAMLQDTGARLAEIVGLRLADIRLNESLPYLIIEAYESRSIKNKNSTRQVPLVGTALWAARKIVEISNNEKAFPRYWKDNVLKSTHASNTLNKSLRTVVPEKSCHSFRHSMKDRLRNVECPMDITNQIGGWKTPGVGEGYGKGYSLKVKHKWLLAVSPDQIE